MKVKFTKTLLNSYVSDFIEDEISDEKTKAKISTATLNLHSS